MATSEDAVGGTGSLVEPPAGDRPSRRLRHLANAFTLLRVALVPVIAVLLAAEGAATRWWAFGIFAFAALTDTIDGWVARRLIGPTRWGQVADPAADKALVIGALVVLALGSEVPWWVVGVIVVREVAVTLQRQWLLRRGTAMPASAFGKVKTVTQVLAIGLYLIPGVRAGVRASALAVAVVATVLSGLEYIWRGRRLHRGA